ncbi:MAG: polysaccharide deacetylase family protein [Gemmobacter sp.]|nr:polysaccharide deacetylase family protein [Gemmobacter sp.]
MTILLGDLCQTLDRMHEQGKCARFWLRDDDAVFPSKPLDRLIGVTADHGVPLVVAVIPAITGAPLAQRLCATPDVSIAVHGWAHLNHAPATQKKQELGAHRPVPVVLAELSEGLSTLHGLYGAQCLPMLVPPWNRIDPEVVQGLAGIGYRGLSVFGPEKPGPLVMLNTHVDLIDWRGTRGGRTDAALVADLQQALAAGIPDIGLLTHHLVHDAQAWDFLARLLAVTANHPACQWRKASDILHDRAALL